MGIPDSRGYRNPQPGSTVQVILKILAKDKEI
jgi:hypothetical protein